MKKETKPKVSKSEKTRRKLLKAAESEFVKKGFNGARVDEIAKKAKLNKGMIYVHFGNKESLYVEVLKRSFERLFASAAPIVTDGGDPIEDTKRIIKWYFWFLSDNPGFVRLFGWETMDSGKKAGDVILSLMEKGLGPLQKIIKLGKEQGKFKKDLAVHKIVTMINEMCLGFFARKKLFEVLWKQDLNSKENQTRMLENILAVAIGGIVAVD